jgi:hypothetical protein
VITDEELAVRQGGPFEFASLRRDRQGVHKGGTFGKSVSWRDVAGTEGKAG